VKGLSSLSHLQYRVIEEIYLSINSKKEPDIETLAARLFYNQDSKILKNAIQSVIKKKLIRGNFNKGFTVPKNCLELNKLILERNKKVKSGYEQVTDNSDQLSFLDYSDAEELFDDLDSWYAYLEEFSSRLVNEKIDQVNLKALSTIYDPFMGTGTTMICANLKGFKGIGFDVNPLMTRISQIKTNWTINTDHIINEFNKLDRSFRVKVTDYHTDDKGKYFSNMPEKELSQWLDQRTQNEICLAKELINHIKDLQIRELFLVVMAKSAFEASYVSLCPGTTFYPLRVKKRFWHIFVRKIQTKINQLKYINKNYKPSSTECINDSCLNSTKYLKNNSIDFAFTSPPYPNDLEYTRQTRLELYLLDLVNNMSDISDIKKKMVKSSTKLIYKESSSEKYILDNKDIIDISNKIKEKLKDKVWGWDYPRMVREYFGDMYLCLKHTKSALKKNSYFMLVCGDQTIQGIYIPVCDILVDMGKDLGFTECTKEHYRDRRSTNHNMNIPEDIVILKK